MSASPVVATGLTVGYGNDPVVEGISLTLQPGESLALVGTNGSGKSTLLKTILGLIPPVAGSLEVLGGKPGKRPQQIAYLGQAHTARFVVPIRAIEVVRMGRFAALGLFGRTTDRDRQLVDDAMAHMGVTNLSDEPLRSLSGGQQQRVYLAQVMAREADLLVLDEPTGGLDVAGREHYRELVEMALARGAAVVTATHDIGEAAGCDQVLLLNRRIVAQGSPRDVLNTQMLLETFGITLQGIQHDDHHDFVIGEMPHGHGHDHTH
ncbi:MAG TPA: ABC transporter ATP-binding protein [Ilumatobacteraceae bacterium]|nr:ABC transporter ATP-binding protein [Ilumatobacteraceae bacterium]HRB03149.1 ABC transporter ATP-binding protein [Ilumatobacteraceae bacterium]